MKSIEIILRVSHHLPQHILLSLYRTLNHPYFEYCNIVWAVNKSCVLDKLFICQKKAVRLITFSPHRCHSQQLFKDCNIMPLKHRSSHYKLLASWDLPIVLTFFCLHTVICSDIVFLLIVFCNSFNLLRQ